MVAKVCGDQGVVTFLLPTMSVDYNFNIWEVDCHDQMRSYASTQLISVRAKYPIFFMLLDAAIINAFLACKNLFGHTKNTLP